MSVRDIHGIPALRERPPGFASTDITNEQTRAINTITPSIVIGQVDEPPLVGGAKMLFGKATGAWSSGNTITLTPCAGPVDGTVTGAANITVYLYLPTTYVPLANQVTITINTILGYWTFMEGSTLKGVLASVPIKVRSC